MKLFIFWKLAAIESCFDLEKVEGWRSVVRFQLVTDPLAEGALPMRNSVHAINQKPL